MHHGFVLIFSAFQSSHILDATQMTTGELVTLKRINTNDHPTEIEITRYFSSEPLASHPRNHCVTLYEVLHIPDNPDEAVLVLPTLRPFNNPPMETVGEAVEFFRQVFEGGSVSFFSTHRTDIILNRVSNLSTSPV